MKRLLLLGIPCLLIGLCLVMTKQSVVDRARKAGL